jgi:hypothetical protein
LSGQIDHHIDLLAGDILLALQQGRVALYKAEVAAPTEAAEKIRLCIIPPYSTTFDSGDFAKKRHC